MGNVINFPRPDSKKTVPVVFSMTELWYLQSVIRHEMPTPPEWKYPPFSLDLNDQICETLVFCVDDQQSDAALELSRADCLAIDYSINPFAKDAAGVAVGKQILIKVMRARIRLRETEWETTEEPDYADARQRMARWNVKLRNERLEKDKEDADA